MNNYNKSLSAQFPFGAPCPAIKDVKFPKILL